MWPQEDCLENSGLGWTVQIMKVVNRAAECRFVTAKHADGKTYANEWIKVSALQPVPPTVTQPMPAPTVRKQRRGSVAAAALRRLSMLTVALTTGTVIHEDNLGISGTQNPGVSGLKSIQSQIDKATHLVAARAEMAARPDAFEGVLAHSSVVNHADSSRPAIYADPKGRKCMLAHENSAGFVADEEREWSDFVSKGYAEVKNAREKPVGMPVYNWCWNYRTRPADGIKPEQCRSRLCFDPRGRWHSDEPCMIPSVPWEGVCLCLALKVQHRMCWTGFDVRQAYMNHRLADGKGYWARMPPGREDESKLVYIPVAIYGAPPSGNQWFTTNSTAMRSGGYIPIPMAPSIFVKISTSGICIVAINTDDGIVLGSTQSQVDEFREFYNSKYEVKWGAITRYGGVNITEHDDGSLTLDQKDFVQKIWTKWKSRLSPDAPCGANGHAPPRLPGRSDIEDLLTPEAIAANSPTPALRAEYMEMLGDIAWLVTRTRHEGSTLFSRLGNAAKNPNENLLQRGLQYIAYVASTVDETTTYKRSDFDEPVCHVDANLGRACSQSGWVAYLANAPVICKSKRQKCAVISVAEAELVALSAAVCDMLWLRQMLEAMGYPPRAPTPVYCDNKAAREVAMNPVAAKNLRHVARRHFFVQDVWRSGDITIPAIESRRNRADPLTKVIDAPAYFLETLRRLRRLDAP